MQDHRQAGLARQLQLRHVEALLARAVQPGHEVVEPDLADRHQPRVVAVRRSAWRSRVAGRRRRRGRRTAGGCPAHRPRLRLRQRAHRVEVRHLHRRQHQLRHAGGAGARHHRGAVGIELGRVEVAVGVDPAAWRASCPTPSPRGAATRWPTGASRRADVAESHGDAVPAQRDNVKPSQVAAGTPHGHTQDAALQSIAPQRRRPVAPPAARRGAGRRPRRVARPTAAPRRGAPRTAPPCAGLGAGGIGALLAMAGCWPPWAAAAPARHHPGADRRRGAPFAGEGAAALGRRQGLRGDRAARWCGWSA